MRSLIPALCATAIITMTMVTEAAAQPAHYRELGTGRIASMGHYSSIANVSGESTAIWSLRSNPILPFPTGCEALSLAPFHMGQSAYKTAVNVLLLARALDKPVRFYSHAANSTSGKVCYADYVEMQD